MATNTSDHPIRPSRLSLWLILASLLCTAFTASAADDAELARLSRKVSQAVADEEWSSVNAIYTRMIDLRPDSVDAYAGAMNSAVVAGDTTVAVMLFERSLHALVPTDSLFQAIENNALAIGFSASRAPTPTLPVLSTATCCASTPSATTVLKS